MLGENKRAYIPGRVLLENLRSFEFFDKYCKEIKVEALLVSLDASNAFDSVGHKYMFATLSHYGFSDEFIETVKMTSGLT